MVNITAVDAWPDGWVKAWPCDEPRSSTSSLNFTPGIVAANAAIVRLASGRICLASSAPVNVVVDVTGWFFGTTDFAASSPNRLLDTRITGDPLRGRAGASTEGRGHSWDQCGRDHRRLEPHRGSTALERDGWLPIPAANRPTRPPSTSRG